MLSAGMGSPGIHELIQKSLSGLQYEEYNLPIDIVRRGLNEIPNYHFRDDALELSYLFKLKQGIMRFIRLCQ